MSDKRDISSCGICLIGLELFHPWNCFWLDLLLQLFSLATARTYTIVLYMKTNPASINLYKTGLLERFSNKGGNITTKSD